MVKLPCTHTSRPRKSMLQACQIFFFSVVFNPVCGSISLHPLRFHIPCIKKWLTCLGLWLTCAGVFTMQHSVGGSINWHKICLCVSKAVQKFLSDLFCHNPGRHRGGISDNVKIEAIATKLYEPRSKYPKTNLVGRG